MSNLVVPVPIPRTASLVSSMAGKNWKDNSVNRAREKNTENKRDGFGNTDNSSLEVGVLSYL